MESRYIHEEVIIQRTAGKENKKVWNKETKILKRFQEYCKKIQNVKTEEGEYITTTAKVSGPYTDFSRCYKIHWESDYHIWKPYFIDDDMNVLSPWETNAAAVMYDLAEADDTHCFELRAITKYGNPEKLPSLYRKRQSDQRIIETFNSDELWKMAVPVTWTEDNWHGELTFSMQLPDTPEMPSCIKDVFHQVALHYCDRKEGTYKDFFELYVEGYEGSWEGGANEDCSIQGNQLPDFLNRMQELSDMVRQLGGTWGVEGWLYSDDFGVLQISVDEQGKVKAEYLKL